MKMSKTTFERRVAELADQLRNHPYRDEIVALATEQIICQDGDEPDRTQFC